MTAATNEIKTLAAKERQRVIETIPEIKVLDDRAKGVLELAHSYRIDAEHFYEIQDYVSAFELYVYIFGLLDALARLKLIDPGKARKHFKVEQ
jgi:hypothetical protein